jgi:hypothetical protein
VTDARTERPGRRRLGWLTSRRSATEMRGPVIHRPGLRTSGPDQDIARRVRRELRCQQADSSPVCRVTDGCTAGPAR